MLLEFPGQERAPAELPRRGKLVLGSSRERADLVLSGEDIEAVHCTIRPLKGGGWALVDMGSDIGTRVNGRVAETVRLAHGDVINLGRTRLTVVDPTAPQPIEPEAAESTPAPSAAGPSDAGDIAGMRISGYRIDKILGRGGMGQVYLALQERLARPVALKILSPALAADVEFVHRFEAEARAAAALNHPNIVTIFDVGDEDGRHFISMEYMHAGCLETRLAREGRLPWSVVLDVLHDAASGLVYAESRGIVHRDIKPSNLMQNEEGATKIADLGLAVQTEQEETQAEGQRVYGTPHFIAPELIHGEKPDSRSDLYSLGATAYRLITGQTPFQGQTPREILRNALNETPAPVASLAADVPTELQQTIERLLQRSPEDRHPSAAILLKEIDRIRLTGGDHGQAEVGDSSRGPGWRLIAAGILLLAAGAWLLPPFLAGGDEASAEVRDVAASAPTGTGADDFEGVVFTEDGTDTGIEAADDDMAARLLETKAELEYLKLGELVLSDEERERRLMELAERFKGTNSAYRAIDEVVSARAARSDAEVQSQADEVAIQAALETMTDVTSGFEAYRVRSAIQALRSISAPGGPTQAAGFAKRRAAFEQTLLERAVEYAEGVLERADRLAAQGDFDGLEALLVEFSSTVELPDAPQDGQASPSALQLEQLATRAYGRISEIDLNREAWLAKQVSVDEQRIATGLRGTDGMVVRLGEFDFEGAVELLDATLADVRTAGSRAVLTDLREDLDAARSALESLGQAWEQNSWRRKSIADPSAPRSAKRDAVGADIRGVLVADDRGTRHLPWGTWAGHPRELHVLFNERLSRPWSELESLGIATLFRLGAVTEAARWATAALADPAPVELEHDLVLAFFDQAEPWADSGSSSEALRDERHAVELLIATLSAQQAGTSGIALSKLERLLTEHPTSLFVLLLSDARPWKTESDEGQQAPIDTGQAPIDTGQAPGDSGRANPAGEREG